MYFPKTVSIYFLGNAVDHNIFYITFVIRQFCSNKEFYHAQIINKSKNQSLTISTQKSS